MENLKNVDLKKEFAYLVRLRDSGKTNMFGATPYLQQEFGMDKEQARAVLSAWMKSFEDMQVSGN